MSDRHISEDVISLGSAGRWKFVIASEELTCNGATEETTDLIPAYCWLEGVNTRVTSGLIGPDTYSVGTAGVDEDRWGVTVSGTIGYTSGPEMYTDIANEGGYVTTATDVQISGNGTAFSSGKVLVTAYYRQLVP